MCSQGVGVTHAAKGVIVINYLGICTDTLTVIFRILAKGVIVNAGVNLGAYTIKVSDLTRRFIVAWHK